MLKYKLCSTFVRCVLLSYNTENMTDIFNFYVEKFKSFTPIVFVYDFRLTVSLQVRIFSHHIINLVCFNSTLLPNPYLSI